MLDRPRLLRVVLLGMCAFALACDVLPKFQLQLQRDLQHEFKLTGAMVMVIDTTHMVVAVFDDAHAVLSPKALALFQQDVAQYAAAHYTRTKLKTVGVVVDRATQRGGTQEESQPTVFVTEYHPDGTVRLAPLPASRPVTP